MFMSAVVFRQPMELAFSQLKVARYAHELDVDGVAANLCVQSNRVRVRTLVSHREEEGAVARNGRCLPHGRRLLSGVGSIAEVAAAIALPEERVGRSDTSSRRIVDDHIAPPQRVAARRR